MTPAGMYSVFVTAERPSTTPLPPNTMGHIWHTEPARHYCNHCRNYDYIVIKGYELHAVQYRRQQSAAVAHIQSASLRIVAHLN